MWYAIGILVLILGGLIYLVNFYRSFVRTPFHLLWHRSLVQYRHVSGTPFVGSLLVALSLIIGWSEPWWMWTALILIFLIDTGGPIWFLIMITPQVLRGEFSSKSTK